MLLLQNPETFIKKSWDILDCRAAVNPHSATYSISSHFHCTLQQMHLVLFPQETLIICLYINLPYIIITEQNPKLTWRLSKKPNLFLHCYRILILFGVCFISKTVLNLEKLIALHRCYCSQGVLHKHSRAASSGQIRSSSLVQLNVWVANFTVLWNPTSFPNYRSQ